MGRTSAVSLTDREAEIMEQLWKLGTATSEQIRAELSGAPHDSTIRTMLRILEEKGFVSHRREGRSYCNLDKAGPAVLLFQYFPGPSPAHTANRRQER